MAIKGGSIFDICVSQNPYLEQITDSIRSDCQSPTTACEGEGVEAVEANETFLRSKEAQRKALNDHKAFSARVKTSRRVILPPHLQHEIKLKTPERKKNQKIGYTIIRVYLTTN